MIVKLLTEHHLEFSKLKRRLQRLVQVYTCQNATLLEITCHGSFVGEMIKCCVFLSTVYDVSGAASDRNCVVLNDIHIDIMDYIVPAICNDTEFRQMWAEFEWENKVAVNTNISGLKEFLSHVLKCTNMKCLTPEKVRITPY